VVVELVGPAGAGKSTLAQRAREADATIQPLSLWGLPRLRLLASALALVPTMVTAILGNRRLRWPEIKYMIRLDALRGVLRSMPQRHDLILLDEGPVFALGWLDLRLAGRRATAPVAWHRRALAEWAKLLDGVIFIDAPDTTLAHRIRTRAKRHRMRKGSDAAISRFAGGFRRAFDRVVAELHRHGRLGVDVLVTDSRLDSSAPRLMTLLARHRNGR